MCRKPQPPKPQPWEPDYATLHDDTLRDLYWHSITAIGSMGQLPDDAALWVSKRRRIVEELNRRGYLYK